MRLCKGIINRYERTDINNQSDQFKTPETQSGLKKVLDNLFKHWPECLNRPKGIVVINAQEGSELSFVAWYSDRNAVTLTFENNAFSAVVYTGESLDKVELPCFMGYRTNNWS